MSVKINYTFKLPGDATHSKFNGAGISGQKVLFDPNLKINFNIARGPSLQSTMDPFACKETATAERAFQASPRQSQAWTLADYALTALKCIFFPVTAMYYLCAYFCSIIAHRFGVGGTDQVDDASRLLLRSLGGQEVSFHSEDKVKLEGMVFNNPRPARGAQTILICSGSHASYEAYTLPMVDALLKLGQHVMVFNYRGFGRSGGSPSEEGFNLDAEAAYQYLKGVLGRSDDQISVLGYSLGAAPATDLAAHHKIKLILDRYFSSMKDVAYDNGGAIAKAIFYLGGADFDVKEKIKKVEGGIFLARGSFDSTMKPYHEEYLRSALASNPKASFVTVNSSHFHHSGTTLWFHPENRTNAEHRNQFLRFLQTSS
ncbi:MAG: alpha/beta fold hydrolase [Verrucomicrobia bacterium]|nr:alpha/beta fold hydrolase [Verrucomicrobiota bacterium]